ncbi:MAG: hypothetical protein GW938_08330 [Leptospira sp.]|nr:hypothetical protein [Leptospira sp.]NCS93533.1 hypothetical protein [Leptospira sp.]
MIKILSYSFVFFILLIIFFISAQSITSAKLVELRLNIQKDQIMNYELSSKALKSKLRQIFLEKDNFNNEIKINILESSFLNSNIQENSFELSSFEKAGIFIVNAVRFISFKPIINLSSNKKNTILLQYAFYLERTRRYKDASDKYKDLEKNLQNDSDEFAFVLLHDGFCLSMLGQNTEAYIQLDKVYNLFPGTHYSENAKLLIDFLKESEIKKESLAGLKSNPSLYSKSLYLNGDYQEVLKELEKMPFLTKDLSFIKARSLEELGRNETAIAEYIPLTRQTQDRNIAIKANRRLMLLSNYYEENKELAKLSQRNAINLGDNQAVKTIEESKDFQQEAKVIDIIQSNEFNEPSLANLKIEVNKTINNSNNSLPQAALKELEADKELSPTMEKISINTNRPVDEIFYPKSFDVILSDGRIITGNSIDFDSNTETAKIYTVNFPIKTPIDNLDTIRIAIPKSKIIKNPIAVILKNGNKKSGNQIILQVPKLKLESIDKNNEKIYNQLNLSDIVKIKL